MLLSFPVLCRRFYLLFQQHCRYDNATTISRTMGEYSYHMVRLLPQFCCSWPASCTCRYSTP
jgi:hypothetical protein